MTQSDKIQHLKDLGYNARYLGVITNEELTETFTLDQLIYLEEQVGETVQIKTVFNNTSITKEYLVDRVSPQVVGAAIMYDGGAITKITPKSLQDGIETGVITRDNSEFDLIDGRRKFANV